MRVPMVVVWWDTEAKRVELQLTTETKEVFDGFAIAGAASAAAQYYNGKIKFPPTDINNLLGDIEKGLGGSPPPTN